MPVGNRRRASGISSETKPAANWPTMSAKVGKGFVIRNECTPVALIRPIECNAVKTTAIRKKGIVRNCR